MKIATFEDVRKFLSDIPNLDYGGCGISALSMYRWLKKNEKETSAIILLYRPAHSGEDVSSYISGPAHCGIEYKGKIIDEDEEICLDLYSNWMKIREKGMLNLLNKNNWNDRFEREKNIHQIEERLGINLSDVCLKV